jgi:hypothetical protein
MTAAHGPAPALDERAPIFVLGVMQRSGTNFLADLLLLHPDTAAPAPLWEDNLLRESDHLVGYARSVRERWDPGWRVPAEVDEELVAHLGDGVLALLTSRAGQRLIVTKTPSVVNLSRFFTVFPRAYLVIIIRDGRAVVESGVKSFGWTYEWTMHQWAEAAATILAFDRAHKDTGARYLVVRYEDLCNDVEGELQRVLRFLNLDVSVYDFAAAARLPIRGSSTLRADGADAVHWKPVDKPDDFNPLERWQHWRRGLHERFNWLAGRQLSELGYPQRRVGTGVRFWAAWNAMLDVKWRLRESVKTIVRGPRDGADA